MERVQQENFNGVERLIIGVKLKSLFLCSGREMEFSNFSIIEFVNS